MDALLDFGNGLSWIEPFGTNFGTVHDLMTPIKLVGIIHLRHPLLREVIPGINYPPAQEELGCQLQLHVIATCFSGNTCQLHVLQQNGRA